MSLTLQLAAGDARRGRVNGLAARIACALREHVTPGPNSIPCGHPAEWPADARRSAQLGSL
jgi:hypothetical protein